MVLKMAIGWVVGGAAGRGAAVARTCEIKRTRRLRTFEEAFPGGAGPGVAGAQGGPRVRDRPEDGRRRDAGADRSRVPEDVRRAELRPAAEGRALEPDGADPAARRPVLLDRRADPARDRRQPVRDPREPRARRPRALQDPAPGAGLHGARPPDRLRAPRAAGVPHDRVVVHQSRAHAAPLPGAASATCCSAARPSCRSSAISGSSKL